MYALSAAAALLFASDPDWPLFTEFQQKYNHWNVYSSIDEWKDRLAIFKDNVAFIRNTNSSIGLGMTPFMDMTHQEFTDKYLSNMVNNGRATCKSFNGANPGTTIPASIDWRSRGAVSSVKDQGQCGSCWAFSATGCAESAWFLSTGQKVDLAEQELVECATGRPYFNLGCNGGNIDSAFEYLIANGQTAEENYPYEATDSHACSADEYEPAAWFSSCSDVPSEMPALLTQAVALQPVSVAIDAGSRYFQHYTSGILTSAECGTELNHAVIIVGYGTDKNTPYWTVKNSWSADWGEQGYVRILRTTTDTVDAGVCGIAMQPSFIQ